MHALFEPLFRKLLPLLAGVAAGMLFMGLPMSLGAVSSGQCATFKGHSEGNDPHRQVVFNLCRYGDQVHGIKTSEGDAGRSIYLLEGRLTNDETFRMEITTILEDAPAPGWISCADDIFTLTWSAQDEALVGHYVSLECEDRASLFLEREARKPRTSGRLCASTRDGSPARYGR